MNNEEHVLYNSNDYKNCKILFKSELFLLSNTYGAKEKLLSNKEIIPDRILIYNNDEYCSLEIVTKSTDIHYSIKEAILNPDIRNKFDLIRTQLTIFPNDKDKNFSLIIADISFFTQIEINDEKITHIYFNPNNAYMHSETDQEIDSDKIFKYLERNVLSAKEKQLIKNVLENQYNIIKMNDSPRSFISSIFKRKNDKQKEENKFKVSQTEQKIFNMDALKIIDGSSHPEADLNNLIGLENVKKEIIKLKAKLEYKKKREQRGIYDDTITNLHMCFLGSPGTGKTTVARIMAGLLYNLGYLKENKCIEIGANELKGGYTGQTAIKTKAILRNAKNKILFIDEAYSLFDINGGGYGKEALDVIIKEMEDNKDNLIIIFAGYQKEMEKFLNMNDGLRSRINRYIYFENYNTIEMTQIFTSFLANKKLYIDEYALEKSLILFKNAALKDRFSNGRFARNLLEKVEEEHAYNVRNIKDSNRRDTITAEDISTDIVRELLTQSM